MQYPDYILIRNGEAAIDARTMYAKVGSDRDFARMIRERIEEFGWNESNYYLAQAAYREQRHIVTFPTAILLLASVRKKAAGAFAKELSRLRVTIESDGIKISNTPANFKDCALPSDAPVKTKTEPQLPEVTAVEVGGCQILYIDHTAAIEASELCRLLSPDSLGHLSNWILYRINGLGLQEGVDFVRPRVGPAKQYVLSLSAAIRVAAFKSNGSLSRALVDFERRLNPLGLLPEVPLTGFVNVKPVPGEMPPPIAAETPQEATNGNEPTTGTSGMQTPPTEPENEPQGESEQAELPYMGTDEGQPQQVSPTGEGWAGPAPEPEPQPQPLEQPQPEPAPINGSEHPSPFSLLVKLCAESLRQAETNLQTAQMLHDLDKRLQFTERTAAQLVGIQQAAGRHALGMPQSTEPMPAVTIREQIKYAVNDRARATGEVHEDIYNWIYGKLTRIYGIRVSAQERRKDETYLAMCERLGIIDKVYAIVNGEEFKAATAEANKG